ncbi:SIR2 family protein, partial [Lysinibacillus capsici]|uniref:SIR2 family protein n=1 Tax=Lysinibacillus capsici TaxID=2115968 RepID=UPI002E1A1835|nr:SIR2 family protein [Lysinibacillus capsici]
MTDRFVETSIKKIKEASENNKLVVFVGAGVSANSGIPTWRELITDMASDLKDFSDKISSDMYLKIPQYYYNERGEKEYFDKLNEVFFSKKFKTNPIHKEIFKLKPAHIITTNYDNLLEDAAIENGYFYHTVRQDSDLPYNNLNKTIIKMHGDFYNRNIVLKEDDYLNYSTNFTLIENYLKSLIATNTVLFIGYSISDPNFNLIFQWVKNILKKDFQPAYLIESSTEYSRLE